MALTMIFDTDCALCSRSVDFVLKHERDSSIQFVGARSPSGIALAQTHGISVRDLDETFVVIDGNRALIRSQAMIRILQHMKAPWAWLSVLRFVPLILRDAGYSAVARHRYKLFGRTSVCYVPSALNRNRFLD
jgi:predicted DCC family thiol-disulfide oxidoreductase YuxK